ncbi:ubiquilin-1-like [Rissa tridactyla]|uniref:ubiquilin-1-like n=1 Tax=Rissa tridactyla TaxID=75485 RepID=UPI0023BA495A|nr:ubiquilin-1-like [Rissa tridactyla]
MSESKGAEETNQPVVTTDPSNTIKVTVKTLKQKEQLEVAQSSTIQKFKEEVAKRFKTLPNLLVLIFAGKVLKDQDTLSQHGVHSGVTIYVVIRSQQRPQDSPADQGRATTLLQTPSHSNSNLFSLGSTNNNAFLLGFLLGVTGAYLLGLDQTDMMDLMSSIQEQDMHSLISEMVQSTLVQNNLDSVDLVRNFIMSNPQMQQLAEENPEIGQILTNPHTITEILEASNNPAVMQEMIRNRDVAMNNLESIPGGYSALEHLYREFEEPILDAVQAQLGNNPFDCLESNPIPHGGRLPAHTENRRPLPNPWAPQSNSVSDNADDDDDQFASSSEGDNFALPSLDPAAGAAIPNSGKVRTLVRQIIGNPELMQNLESALTNPDSPAQILLNGAQVPSEGNASPQGQWPQQVPPEMEDTEISSLLRNPRALRALLQIHLGLQTLSIEVTDFIPGLEDSHVDLESMDDSAQSSESEEDAILVSDEDEEESQMVMGDEVPQTRFKREMEQLFDMGFQDQSANLQALIDAEGDISEAVKILAKGPSSNKTP